MSIPQAGSTSAGSTALGWFVMIVLNVALPIVTYDVLTDHGVGQVPALLLGGVWPALELAVNLIRSRKIDEFSVLVLIFVCVGVISALAFNSPRLVLIKEGASTGLFGLALLASLLAPRPLMFYFGRRFATSGIPERIDEFSVLVLIFVCVGVISALAFNSPRLVLIKEGASTGLFGLALLASLLAPRPLMFYFGRRFATSGIPERIDWWNGLWQYKQFRWSQRMLTVVWGVALAGSAGICIALTFALSVSTMVVVMNVVPYVVIGLLIVGTTVYGRRAQRRPGAARPPVPAAEPGSAA